MTFYIFAQPIKINASGSGKGLNFLKEGVEEYF